MYTYIQYTHTYNTHIHTIHTYVRYTHSSKFSQSYGGSSLGRVTAESSAWRRAGGLIKLLFNNFVV